LVLKPPPNSIARDVESAHGIRRNKMLRLAILSSGMSKVTAIALQGIAIPLVFHALGSHQYALYLLFSAALATLALLQFGAGPGLTQTIAKAHAQGNKRDEAGALAAAFLFVGATALLGAIVCLTVVRLVSAANLFGNTYAADQVAVIHVAGIAVLVTFLSIVLGVVDSALAGYQEQVATNLSMCFSNVLSTIALVVLCRSFHPTIAQILVITYGGPVVCRLANLALLLARRPYLLDGFTSIKTTALRPIIHVGAAFWLIQATGVIEQHAGTFIMGHLTSALETDIFGVIYRASCLASATVAIFTQPLWPAFTDAVSRHDSGWVQRTAAKIRRAIMSIAAVLAVLMITAGAWGVEHIWKIDISANRLVVVTLGLYMFSNLWTHFHYIVLMGLDRVWSVAALVIVENLTMLGLGWFAVPHFGAQGMAAAYLLASVVIPAWILPRILRKRMAANSFAPQDPIVAGAQ
jgi:O-antigen/teichoic acid export membrane protein